MDTETIMSMNCESLRGKLRELGLDTTGLKTVLRDRLLQHFGHQADGDDAESTNSEYQEFGAGASAGVRSKGSVFTMKDIADSLSSFSGTDLVDIRDWVVEFEENAEIVGWNSIQKFIYGKQLLKGAARLFVRSQSGLRNWESLKNALIEEFGEKLCSADVHNRLRNRRKNSNETYREYLYALMEIGKPINLDVQSLIDYFVEGIPDSRFNKANLYQAKTVEELKEQIRIYEKIRASRDKDANKSKETHGVAYREEKNKTVGKKNCFKCGNSEHLAKDCGETQFKCFKCNGAGHRANDCKVDKPIVKQERSTVNIVDFSKEPLEPGLKFKKIVLGSFELYSLIDTGCSICIVRSDVYDRLKNKFPLVTELRRLKGAGSGIFYTLGYIEAPVLIDDIKLKIRFYVVRADDLDYPAVLGTSLLQFGDLIIREEGIEFIPKTGRVDKKDYTKDNGIDGTELMGVESCLKTKVDDKVVQDEVRSDDISIGNKKFVAEEMEVISNEVVMNAQIKGKMEREVVPLRASEFPLPVMSILEKGGFGEEYCRNRRLNFKGTGKGRIERDVGKSRRMGEDRNTRGSDRNHKMEAVKRPSSLCKVSAGISQGDCDTGNLGKTGAFGRQNPAEGHVVRRAPVFGSNTPSGGPNVGWGSIRLIKG